jgi:hypothetical protein
MIAILVAASTLPLSRIRSIQHALIEHMATAAILRSIEPCLLGQAPFPVLKPSFLPCPEPGMRVMSSRKIPRGIYRDGHQRRAESAMSAMARGNRSAGRRNGSRKK